MKHALVYIHDEICDFSVNGQVNSALGVGILSLLHNYGAQVEKVLDGKEGVGGIEAATVDTPSALYVEKIKA